MNVVSEEGLSRIEQDIAQLETEGYTKDQAIEIIKLEVLIDMLGCSNRISKKLEFTNENIHILKKFQQKGTM